MRLTVFALIALLLAPCASAQIGRLGDRLRRSAERAVERTTEEVARQRPADLSDAADALPNVVGRPLEPTGPMPVGPSGHAPAIDLVNWIDVLSGSYSETTDGQLRTGLPDTYGTSILFPVEGATYQVVVTDEAGRVVMWRTADLTLRDNPTFGNLLTRVEGDPFIGLAAGTYRIAVTANGHEIGALPVTVRAHGGGLYDTRATLRFDGPWATLGVIHYDLDTDDPQLLKVRFWMAPEDASAPSASFDAVLYRGSEEIGRARRISTVSPSDESGKAASASTFFGPGSRRMILRDLADGEYRVEVVEAGRAPVRVFRFRMAGGEPVAHPRSALDTPRDALLPPVRGWFRLPGQSLITQTVATVWLETD